MSTNGTSHLLTGLIAFALSATSFGANAASVDGAPRVTCGELRRLQLAERAAVEIIDIRSPAEFAKGHIQGARNVTVAELAAEPSSRSRSVVVYCGSNSCGLSARVLSEARSLGFRNVAILDGGLDEWLRRRYPAEVGGRGVHSLVEEMSARAAQKGLDEGMLAYDVRSANEFQAGHLPGVRNMPLESLDGASTAEPMRTRILVIDRFPSRSKEAAKRLRAMGHSVAELKGGMAAWIKAGLPLEVK